MPVCVRPAEYVEDSKQFRKLYNRSDHSLIAIVNNVQDCIILKTKSWKSKKLIF